MNYVHYSLAYLIELFGDLIAWLFDIEVINYEDTSITFGETFIYFFIVFVVISFILHARFNAVGEVVNRSEHK